MKSITSRLQSRISKRRNVIRAVEQDVALIKSQRHAIRELDMGEFGYSIVANLNENLRDARGFVKGLADDQRLDKQLKSMVNFGQRIGLFGVSDF